MRVAIVGATGAVGQEFIRLLERRDFSLTELRLYASARSAGKVITYKNSDIIVEVLPEDGNLQVDIAFISVGSSLSKQYAKKWAEHGALVIDNSSAWRMDEATPLVIPEVNPEDIRAHQGIIANPNCSTIIALMALAPLHRAFGITRTTIATYQAVSGAGAAGIEELRQQSKNYLDEKALEPELFQHPIGFNLFSHDSDIAEDGYNTEERKLLFETQKILHDDGIRISATCIRVPVFRAHSEAIHLEFSQHVTVAEAKDVLEQAEGVRIVDDRQNNHFPMPLEASGQDDVLVGRIRQDSSCDNGLVLFVSGDQISKGAALNAVQIAEKAQALGVI